MTELKKMLAHVGHLVQEAKLEDLRSYLAQCLEQLDRGPLLPERFHKPVLKALQKEGLWNHIEMVCRDLELSYGADIQEDESLKRMLRSGRKAISKTCPIPFAPEEMHGELWWEGRAEAPARHKGEPIAERFLGYVTDHPREGFYTLYLVGHDEDNYLDVIKAVLPREVFVSNLGGGDVRVNCRCEMVCYANEESLYFFEE
jgi:hypothetical protein